MKFLLTLFFISLAIAPHAYAASSGLPKSDDCPLARPFSPKPDPQGSAQEYRVTYPLDGYKISRIQISAREPADLDITWTPAGIYFEPMSESVSITAKEPQCFYISPGFPVNTPAKQIEIRAQKPVKGLKVSFSDVPWDKDENCSAQKICPTLVKNMNACKLHKGSKECDYFIDNLHDLALQNECRRSFDSDFVPAIWLCDETATDDNLLWDTMFLLRSLKSKRAQEYYKSKEFELMLDGHLAEEYKGL